jgi:hypothetical protein
VLEPEPLDVDSVNVCEWASVTLVVTVTFEPPAIPMSCSEESSTTWVWPSALDVV